MDMIKFIVFKGKFGRQTDCFKVSEINCRIAKICRTNFRAAIQFCLLLMGVRVPEISEYPQDQIQPNIQSKCF